MIQVGNKDVKNITLGNTQVSRVYKGDTSNYNKSVMDSLICWIDIERQGCTNENMRKNPILKDLSGNGNDFTCSNFTWDTAGGIGMYNTNFYAQPSRSTFTQLGAQHWIIHSLTNPSTTGGNEPIIQQVSKFIGLGKTVTIKVSGLVNDGDIVISIGNKTFTLHNGDNIVQFPENSTATWVIFRFNHTSLEEVEIQILPEVDKVLYSMNNSPFSLAGPTIYPQDLLNFDIELDKVTCDRTESSFSITYQKESGSWIRLTESAYKDVNWVMNVTNIPSHLSSVNLIFPLKGWDGVDNTKTKRVTLTTGYNFIPKVGEEFQGKVYIDGNSFVTGDTFSFDIEPSYKDTPENKTVITQSCIFPESVGYGVYAETTVDGSLNMIQAGINVNDKANAINGSTFPISNGYYTTKINFGPSVQGTIGSIAPYYLKNLLVFNRILTDEEVGWVENNLLYPIPYNIQPIDEWIFSKNNPLIGTNGNTLVNYGATYQEYAQDFTLGNGLVPGQVTQKSKASFLYTKVDSNGWGYRLPISNYNNTNWTLYNPSDQHITVTAHNANDHTDAYVIVSNTGEHIINIPYVDESILSSRENITIAVDGETNKTILLRQQKNPSYIFDGTNDYMECIFPENKQVKTAILKVACFNDNSIVYDSRTGQGAAIAMFNSSQEIAYNARNVGGSTYIDGVENITTTCEELMGQIHTVTLTNENACISNVLRLGRSKSSSNYAKCQIYYLAVYDRVLTNGEINVETARLEQIYNKNNKQ